MTSAPTHASTPTSTPAADAAALATATAPVPVAAIQMVSATQPEANMAAADRLVREAAAAGARIVALPEYWCILGRRDTDKVAIRERDGDGPLQAFMAELARAAGVWLIGGTVPLVADSAARVRNTSLAFTPDGAPVARYDKIHLFGLDRGDEKFNESATIEPGRTPVLADLGGLRVGMSVCYDVRFPELYRALAPVDLIVVPSAFTYTTGRAHWELLLRARAVENQCYVLAPAQGGVHENGRRTWGHTMLVDPWGEVLAQRDEGEGVVAGTIDPARLAEVRRTLPALRHRTM